MPEVSADVTMEDAQQDQSKESALGRKEGFQQASKEEETPRALTFAGPPSTFSDALTTAVEANNARYAHKALLPFLRIDRTLQNHLDTLGNMSKEEYKYWKDGLTTVIENEEKKGPKDPGAVVNCGDHRCLAALIGLERRAERSLAGIHRRLEENPEQDTRDHYTRLIEAVKRLPKGEKLVIFGKLFEANLNATLQTAHDEVMQDQPNHPTERVQSQFAVPSSQHAPSSVRSASTIQGRRQTRRGIPQQMAIHTRHGPSRSHSPQGTPRTALFGQRSEQQLNSVLPDLAPEERSTVDSLPQGLRPEGRAEGRLRKHRVSDYDALASPSKRPQRSPVFLPSNRERVQIPTSEPFHHVWIDLRVPFGWQFCLVDRRFSLWKHLDDSITHTPPSGDNGFYKQRFTVRIPLGWDMYCKRGGHNTADYPIYYHEGTDILLKESPVTVDGYSVRTLPSYLYD